MSQHAAFAQVLDPSTIPQSEPLNERMVKNHAGGYAFELDDWDRLDRFLILGTEGGTYYVKERPLTQENATVVQRCLARDGLRTVKRIADISDSGRAPKNDPALFALALALTNGDAATKDGAVDALPTVARIGTHLLHLAAYVNALRGWGRLVRRGFAGWYLTQPAVRLAQQVTKYANRDGWTHRDVLRLCHAKVPNLDGADTAGVRAVLQYAVKGEMSGEPTDATSYLGAVSALKRCTLADASAAAALIAAFNLPREVVPTELLTLPATWEALLPHMGVTAMIRNLATMTRVGVIGQMGVPEPVRALLTNAEAVRKSRVHPMQVFLGQMTYAAGRGERGQHTWTPNSQVLALLEDVFYAAFANVVPTGKRTMVAIDVSGSMSATVAGIPGVTARTAAAVMAMTIVRTEPTYAAIAFDTNYYPLQLHARMSLREVDQHVNRWGGGTDCSLPFVAAQQNKLAVDRFVILTDSETWAGAQHPQQRFDAYRAASQSRPKVAIASTAATGTSIGDPKDPDVLQCVGLDASLPSIIADFCR